MNKNSKSIIFCQFSTEKLFTLKLIIYISSHAICFQFFYTSANLEILMPSIKKFFTLIIYILSHVIHFEFFYALANFEMDAINKFVLKNAKATLPWVVLYEEKRRKCNIDKKPFRWLNGRSMPYPNHLKENMPMIFPNSWVVD